MERMKLRLSNASGATIADALGLESRTVTGRDLLLGSAFSLTGETASGGSAGFWGQAAVSGFDGRQGALSALA